MLKNMDSTGTIRPFCFLYLTCLASMFLRIAGDTSNDDVRLVGGNHPYEGRVEVMYNLQWGSVCDDHWSMDEAEVVCKELGYSGADQALVAASYGEGVGPIWLDDVHCTGIEGSLFACDHNRVGTHNCGHQDDASVVCTQRGSLRLSNGSTAHDGVLEIRGNSTERWNSVCSDTWDDSAGSVACRQLGFSGYLNSWLLNNATYRQNLDEAYLSGYHCYGNERRLEDCTDATWMKDANCSFKEDVAIQCDPTVVRLMDGYTPSEGRVEIFYGGTWGTVCDDYWDILDAHVVCYELGYDLGAMDAPRNSYFGLGSGAILLDNVECAGCEASIFDCDHSGFANDNCNHYTDAGAVCLSARNQIRLLSGVSSYEGVVEILLDGVWGLLCDAEWGVEEAHVTCRQLGWSQGTTSDSVLISQLQEHTFIRNYECNGEEDKLIDCPWANNGIICWPEDVAQVYCGQPKELDIRLTDGGLSDQGRLEIFFPGSWGTMASLGPNEAVVACRQLGYESMIDVYDNGIFGEGDLPIWNEDLFSCDGSEMRLEDCTGIDDYQGGIEPYEHNLAIGLLCKPFDSIGLVEVRLVPEPDSISSTRGRLEVLHDGIWGSVCSAEGWQVDEPAIRTVCRQLGHISGSYAVLRPGDFTVGAGKVWLDNVVCDTDDPSLGHCYHSAWGYGITCSHRQDIGLDCFYVETADQSSSGIPAWEIAIICLMAIMVFGILIVMAIVQRSRDRRRCDSPNRTIGAFYRENSVDFNDNPNFCDAPPPAYRPPTPPPAESPPSYDSVVKPVSEDAHSGDDERGVDHTDTLGNQTANGGSIPSRYANRIIRFESTV